MLVFLLAQVLLPVAMVVAVPAPMIPVFCFGIGFVYTISALVGRL